MLAHAYTEDQLVERPAIGLLAEQSALPNPQPGLSATLLPVVEGTGMRVRSLGVLGSRLSRTGAGLERLNPAPPPDAITAAVDELTRDRSAMSLFSGLVNLKSN